MLALTIITGALCCSLASAVLPPVGQAPSPRAVYATIRLNPASETVISDGFTGIRGYPSIYIAAGNGEPAMAIGFDEEWGASSALPMYRVTIYTNPANDDFVPTSGNLFTAPSLQQYTGQWGTTTQPNRYFYDASTNTGSLTQWLIDVSKKTRSSEFQRMSWLGRYLRYSGFSTPTGLLGFNSVFQGAMSAVYAWDDFVVKERVSVYNVLYQETSETLAAKIVQPGSALSVSKFITLPVPVASGNKVYPPVCSRRRSADCSTPATDSDLVLGPDKGSLPGGFDAAFSGKGPIIPFGLVEGATLLRIGKVIGQAAIVAEAAVKAAGVAGALASVAFVIVDIINGDHTGAIMGAVGLGVAAGLLVLESNPITFFIGAVLSTILAILPGLFSSGNLPSISSPQEIIQYSMYGDAHHQDNAACVKNNPNCTILYNAGVLARTFQWNNLEAVSFLLQYNQGYAMTMTDLAAAFNGSVVNYSTTPGNGIVSILCQNHKPQPCLHQVCGTSSNPGEVSDEDTSKCNTPKFVINLDMIQVPTLNVTASSLQSRIIPTASGGGDCALVGTTQNGTYSNALNQTIAGIPSAIICGIDQTSILSTTSAASANGTVVGSSLAGNSTAQGAALLNANDGIYYNGSVAATNTTGTNTTAATNGTTSDGYGDGSGDTDPGIQYSPANESTSGAGQLETFPPITPFASLANLAVGLGQRNSSTVTYFVSGQYSTQYNTYGFALAAASTGTGPVNSSIRMLHPTESSNGRQPGNGPPIPFDFRLPQNGSSTNPQSLAYAASQYQLLSLNVTISKDPCAITLFSQTLYHGDAISLGPGNGNLTTAIAKTAQSIKFAGGAGAYLFAESYGDKTAHWQNTDVEDLSAIGLGLNGNWAKEIVALSVQCGGSAKN